MRVEAAAPGKENQFVERDDEAEAGCDRDEAENLDLARPASRQNSGGFRRGGNFAKGCREMVQWRIKITRSGTEGPAFVGLRRRQARPQFSGGFASKAIA